MGLRYDNFQYLEYGYFYILIIYNNKSEYPKLS